MGKKRGRPRKSVEQHKAEGTYRRDRHGAPGDGLLDWEPKPTAAMSATAKSQRRWIRNAADELAVRNGCRFNERLADHVCRFFPRFLCHSKGEWAGQPFELNPFQREEIIYPLYGWVRSDGSRRFRQTYIEIPKKNYKSTTAAGIGLYGLCGDEEAGAEVYSLGADKAQAQIVHAEAINMVDASPELKAVLKINRTTGSITYPATKSFYKALSATPRGKHGINASLLVVDELHEWYGDDLWNAMRYASRARRQPIRFVITNAGDDLESICRRQHDKARGVLNGTVKDDSFFALIKSVERKEAELEVEKVRKGRIKKRLSVARRCNPALGDVIREEDLFQDIRDAIQTPSELPNLMRLTYGVWDTSVSPWLSMLDWDACQAEFSEETLAGQPCWAGLDMSKTGDMTALCLVFADDGQDTFRQLCFFWLPEETIEKRSHLIDYRSWERDGWLRVIPGPVIDYAILERDLQEILARFDCQGVVYDPAYAQRTAQWLDEELDVTPIEMPQTIMRFMNPTAEYERLILAHRLLNNGNAVLRWQAGHCQVRTDVNKNRRPVKPKHGDIRAIDGIVAGIMALSQALGQDDDDGTEEITVLEF